MKNIFIVIIVLLSFSFVFAQGSDKKPFIEAEIGQKPLTQAEYVRLLYQLEQNPSIKQDVIAALRTRGIDFKLTSGLRSLTRSKGRNDEELKSTLEEANRRRDDPTAAKLPSEVEAKDVIEKARQNTLSAADEMPDFVVKQLLRRSIAYANTNRWNSLDRAIIGVSYSTTQGEQYVVLSVDGVIVNSKKADSYHGLNGGATTTGEFVKILKKVFERDSETKFRAIDTALIKKRNTIVYEYDLDIGKFDNGISYGLVNPISVKTGLKGKIWVDRELFRVLKIEAINTDIPLSFPVTALTKTIDYDWVTITDQTYLLPAISESIFTARQDRKLIQSRNVIKFKDYQKFGTEIIILDDDDEEVFEDEKTEVPKETQKEVDPQN